MKQRDTSESKPAPTAVLVKAHAEPEQPAAPHPDRALYEQIIGLRWAELRAYYNQILGHPPTCKNCGHKL